MHKTIASVVLAGLVLSSAVGEAAARKHRRAPALPPSASLDGTSIPLTVNRRSWLDPGNAVSTTQNGGANYVADNTVLNRTQDRIFAPDGFGNDVIKGQPYVPGRTQPAVEFSTLPNGTGTVDNVLFPQNFYFNPAPDLP